MRKHITSALIMAALSLSGTVALAQVDNGPPPEQLQIMQKMQEVQAKIMDNKQKQGVDPMQFFQQMMQQAQSGEFDQAAMEQQLLDKGLIDQATIDDVRQSVQKLTMDGIKREIGATDEEWTVILPKITALLTAQAGVGQQNQGGQGMGMGGMGMTQGARPDVAKALRELRVAIRDHSTPPETIAEKLKACRDAKAAAQADLAAAQKDLTDILTLSQEATLVRLGLLP